MAEDEFFQKNGEFLYEFYCILLKSIKQYLRDFVSNRIANRHLPSLENRNFIIVGEIKLKNPF